MKSNKLSIVLILTAVILLLSGCATVKGLTKTLEGEWQLTTPQGTQTVEIKAIAITTKGTLIVISGQYIEFKSNWRFDFTASKNLLTAVIPFFLKLFLKFL